MKRDDKMIGIIYTGETENRLMEEISSLGYFDYLKDFKIFVEPNMEAEFCRNVNCSFSHLNLKHNNMNGYVSKFYGVDVTNTEIESEKQNIIEVTLQEIADKFGTSKGNLRIKD